jgi:hypothetical protein
VNYSINRSIEGASQANIHKEIQAKLAELKGVALDIIPYPRSNDLLAKYQKEILQQ